MIAESYEAFAILGVSRENTNSIITKLLEAYKQPHRTYHNGLHIISGLQLIERFGPTVHRPEEVFAAFWFHDAIYNTRRDDNEAKSAEWARAELTHAGVYEDVIQRISKMIEMTAGHTAPAHSSPEEKLLLDVDLSILGTPPEVFDEFDDNIRREFWWVEEEFFKLARTRVLNLFLERSAIYLTPQFASREAQAKQNLKRKIEELNS